MGLGFHTQHGTVKTKPKYIKLSQIARHYKQSRAELWGSPIGCGWDHSDNLCWGNTACIYYCTMPCNTLLTVEYCTAQIFHPKPGEISRGPRRDAKSSTEGCQTTCPREILRSKLDDFPIHPDSRQCTAAVLLSISMEIMLLWWGFH